MNRKRLTFSASELPDFLRAVMEEVPKNEKKEVAKIVEEAVEDVHQVKRKRHEVKEAEDPKPPKTNKFAFDTPLRMCVVGESGSGKTQWTCRYLKECPFDQVIWCAPGHSLHQDAVQELKKFYTKEDKNGRKQCFLTEVDCTDGIPHDQLWELIDNGFDQDWETAVVFDDCIDFTKDKMIGALFTGGRHKKVSIFELLQQIFPPGSRKHRLNCSQYVIFKFPARSEFGTLASQICFNKETRNALVDRYRELTNDDEHACMILDMKTKSTEEYPCKVRINWIDNFDPEFWNV